MVGVSLYNLGGAISVRARRWETTNGHTTWRSTAWYLARSGDCTPWICRRTCSAARGTAPDRCCSRAFWKPRCVEITCRHPGRFLPNEAIWPDAELERYGAHVACRLCRGEPAL